MSEEELPEQAVQMLVTWRKRNRLSQRAAVKVMQGLNFPVTLTTLSKWEAGDRQPGKLAAKALMAFLKRHPRVSKADGGKGSGKKRPNER